MGEKGWKISTTNEKAREPVKSQTFCCVVCFVHFLGEKRNFLAGRGLCFVSCSFLLLVLVLVLFQGSHVQLGLACVCILERCWCSRSLFLLGLGRFSLYRDTRSLWRSLNTRGGCFCERKSKSTNSKARHFRASIWGYRDGRIWQHLHTLPRYVDISVLCNTSQCEDGHV